MASCAQCGHEMLGTDTCAFCGAPEDTGTRQATPPHPSSEPDDPYSVAAVDPPRVSTLEVVTVRHIAADVIAAVLLVVALALPWNYTARGYATWYVDIAVALSLASLALPWFLQDSFVLLKRLFAAPAGLCVIAAVVIDLAHFEGLRHYVGGKAPSSGGVGSAVGVLAAGAILAALPRDPERPTARAMAGTRVLTLVLGALGLLCALAATVAIQFRVGGWGTGPPGLRYAALVDSLVPLIVWTTAVVSAATGRRHGRPALVALAAMNVLIDLVYVDPHGPLRVNLPPVETMSQTVYGDWFFLAAGFAATAYWTSTRTPMQQPAGHDHWLSSARQCFLLSCLALGFTGAQALASGVALRRAPEFHSMSLSRIITVTACCLVGAAIAAVAAWMMRPRYDAPRIALGVWLLLVGLGIVILALNDPTRLLPLAWPMPAGCFALPLAAVLCVALPGWRRGDRSPEPEEPELRASDQDREPGPASG